MWWGLYTTGGKLSRISSEFGNQYPSNCNANNVKIKRVWCKTTGNYSSWAVLQIKFWNLILLLNVHGSAMYKDSTILTVTVGIQHEFPSNVHILTPANNDRNFSTVLYSWAWFKGSSPSLIPSKIWLFILQGWHNSDCNVHCNYFPILTILSQWDFFIEESHTQKAHWTLWHGMYCNQNCFSRFLMYIYDLFFAGDCIHEL